MKKVLVTGSNGQLGRCIKDALSSFPELDIYFTTKTILNIEDEESVEQFFRENKFDYCINTAAFTNVEKAENEIKKVFKTNSEAVKNLVLRCKEKNTVLIQISTDYVFDGKKRTPYKEEDLANPLNVYGASKLKGERYIEEIYEKYFIFRTSWLYSQYGNNFLISILKNLKDGNRLTITTEQTGTPTNANDLAKAILEIIASGSVEYGLYHYSNAGEITWYDFAKAILQDSKQFDQTKLAKTDHYRTFAARPKYSVLNTNKYSKTFNRECIEWKLSLTSLLRKINYNQ